MKNEVETELTFDDDSRYVVDDNFVINNKEYLYLVNDADDKDASLVSVVNDTINVIEDDEEFNMAFNELVSRNKENIINMLEEADEN